MFLRRWGSISLFLSHAWLCLQVSLWIFWSWSNNWWQQIKWFNIFVSESLLALPPGFPLEFLHLEELLMTYWSVHVVIGASALALRYARGLIFFSISSASNFRGGLPKESLRLDQSFQNNLMKTYFSCRAFWISMPLVTLWTQISLKYAAEAVIRVQILPISSKSLIKYWPPG